jgi:hypothetical protein
MERLLNESEFPKWFNYPQEFLRLIDQNLLDFDPWIILQGERLRTRFHGIRERFPNRDLVPFARREDNDDVACWENGRPGVIIIHDFSTSGHEEHEHFKDFWDWFRNAIEVMIEYEP